MCDLGMPCGNPTCCYYVTPGPQNMEPKIVSVDKDADLRALAFALQDETAPLRVIDAIIAEMCGWRRGYVGPEKCWYDAAGEMRAEPPRFTETFEAAMYAVKTLAPSWRLNGLRDRTTNAAQRWSVELQAWRDVCGAMANTPAVAILRTLVIVLQSGKQR